ncbi:MAG: hypothetical protein E7478_08290 [Ruminococcaceae bacterium]|nr:hypothetical protein [Oscillospiraceae bacterium]
MNDQMNRQSSEILKSVYRNADMAYESSGDVLKHCANTKLRNEISAERERYRSVASQARAELVRRGSIPKPYPPHIKMMSKMGIGMKTMMDSNSQKLAELMVRGTTMGIIDMQHALNNSAKADERIKQEADSLLKREQQFCDHLKRYL